MKCDGAKPNRAQYLEEHHPTLYKLCVAADVPTVLEFRLNTKLPFCYGRSNDGSPVPAKWDDGDVSVIPLWESGSGVIAIRENSGAEEFVEIYYDDPDEVNIIAKSVDGLFVYVFYFLVESAGGPQCDGFAEIQNLASYLEFNKLDLVIGLVSKCSKSGAEFDSFWEITRSI